jgi:hypothetical protein
VVEQLDLFMNLNMDDIVKIIEVDEEGNQSNGVIYGYRVCQVPFALSGMKKVGRGLYKLSLPSSVPLYYSFKNLSSQEIEFLDNLWLEEHGK